MTSEGDAQRKRVLFQTWLSHHAERRLLLASTEQTLNERAVLKGLTALVESQPDREYVYLLTEHREGQIIPAYIGKSTTPVTRWTSHLKNLLRGTGSYARWQRRLLQEGTLTARSDLHLTLVGQTQVQFPPIPDFPTTIGAVEYQLIGLAADAFQERLLNHEGQGR